MQLGRWHLRKKLVWVKIFQINTAQDTEIYMFIARWWLCKTLPMFDSLLLMNENCNSASKHALAKFSLKQTLTVSSPASSVKGAQIWLQ